MPEQLSRRQVELILRRTTELERKRDATSDDVVTADDLQKVAAELGLSQEALRQALAESRAGLLRTEEERGLVDRLLGLRLIETRRFVPGEVAWVRAAVTRFFEEQGYQIRRHRGDTIVWEAAKGVWTQVKTMFRGGAYKLPRELEIEVTVTQVPGGPYPVLVQLRVDAGRMRNEHLGGVAAVASIGTAGAIVGAALLPMPVELATWAAGAAIGVAAGLGGRATYRKGRDSVELSLERFLDFLEHEPPGAPQLPEAPRDPISRIVEFLSSRDWWR